MNEIRDNELSLRETKTDKEQRAASVANAKALERKLIKQAQREIVDIARRYGGTVCTEDIALAMGKSIDDVSRLLNRLIEAGLMQSALYDRRTKTWKTRT